MLFKWFHEYPENTKIHCYNYVSELLGWSAVDCITCLSKLRKNLRIRKLSNANLWDACSTINNLPRKVPDENDVVKPFNAIIRWREESLYRFGHILWLGRNQPGKGFECPYPQPRLKGVE
ncbi:hypothetical protein [Paraferrimonas sp. SM1919]|uniref:hypothetical protein n=1 Tax=Paraferrimonas sp. SM1919 TaxID=2662263 RepID=UPI0013D67898|nr:hypothetical protein [Paraferrimonas sp. SM1919]